MAQAQTIPIDTRTIKDLLITLRELKNEVAKLRESLVEPLYGSDAWWKREVIEGEKEISAGKYRAYKSVNKLIADLRKGI